MSDWKYYDQTKDKIFDLPAFKLENENTGYSYRMNGMSYVKSPDIFVISINSTKFDSDYISNMLN